MDLSGYLAEVGSSSYFAAHPNPHLYPLTGLGRSPSSGVETPRPHTPTPRACGAAPIPIRRLETP